MKKTLLVSALLASSFAGAYAWNVGEEVSDKIINPSFTEDPMTGWTLESTKGSFTKTGGLFEVYDGAGVDLYQYVQLPRGRYKVECQAYYRCGNSWQDDPTLFDTEDWEDNAILYVSNGTYDIDSNAFTESSQKHNPLMPRLFERYNGAQIYEDLVKEGWDMSDGHYRDNTMWGPCSVPGSLAWFNAGYYKAYDISASDDEAPIYNTVTFNVEEEGYVKIGISKIEAKGADSFMCTNWKLTYVGEPVDDNSGYMRDIKALKASLEKVVKPYKNYIFGQMYTEWAMEMDFEPADEETANEVITTMQNKLQELQEAVAKLQELEIVYKSANLLVSRTEYAGKATFQALVNSAARCVDPLAEIDATDTFGMFATILDQLKEGRITYILTAEAVNAAWDFSSLINNAFLVNNEYTPAWDAEAGDYKFPTIEGVAEELQIENTWATEQEKGYKSKFEENPTWIDITSNVKISEKDVEGQWVIKPTMWHGDGTTALTVQHGYIGMGAWAASATGNPEDFYQVVSGLPNGFYSMSGLMCNAGADVSELQYVYIQSGDKIEKANLTQKGNPWWGGNRDVWRQSVWQKLTTNMIHVTDGKVTIGARSDAFYSTTGFQLYYYGANPNYKEILAPALTNARARLEDLIVSGDQTNAQNILNQINPDEITTPEQYEEACKKLDEYNDYVSTAITAWNDHSKLISDNVNPWVNKFDNTTDEYTVAYQAWLSIIEVGSKDEVVETYNDAENAKAKFNAYVTYLSFIASVKANAGTDAEVQAEIARQFEDLKENAASIEKLNEYTAAISAPYHKAMIAQIGGNNATENAPVDATVLILNPDFTSGSAAPWTGPVKCDSIGNGECYDTDFVVEQTIKKLPQGTYRVSVNAFYRDGDGGTAYKNWATAFEEIEYWATANVTFYGITGGNECGVKVKSIAVGASDEPSFTKYVDKWVEAEEADAQGNKVMIPHYAEIDMTNIAHPFDTQIKKETHKATAEDVAAGKAEKEGVEIVDAYCYIPNSIWGARAAFAKENNPYNNSFEIYVEEGADLTIGLKKSEKIGSDWCIFDDFKLEYLGKAVSTGIETASANKVAESYFSVSGVRKNTLSQGINIVKMSDGSVKKVLVK